MRGTESENANEPERKLTHALLFRPQDQTKEMRDEGECRDFLVRRLSEWGVKRIFGFPGDGINGIMGRAEPRSPKNRFYPGAARGDGRIHGVRTPNSPAR
jgi:hypothetical protein